MEDPSRTTLHDLHLASRKAEEAALRRFQAAGWLESFVGPIGFSNQPSEFEFVTFLKNGLVLCNVINKIQPGAVQKVIESNSPSLPLEAPPLLAYQYFENVRNFLVAVEELKLPAFEASDLETNTLEAGSTSKIVDCVLALKMYHEWKQWKGAAANGSYVNKHARSPMVPHFSGSGRPLSQIAPATPSGPRRHLDMSVANDQKPQTEAQTNKNEDSLIGALTQCLINTKENMDHDLLGSFRRGNLDSVKLVSKIMSTCLQEEQLNQYPEGVVSSVTRYSSSFGDHRRALLPTNQIMRGGGGGSNLISSGSSSSTGSGANNIKKLECFRVYKRRKVANFSNLPQEILHDIFTFLDLKQAIQTSCLLSKSWRYFWVSLPTLNFNYIIGKVCRSQTNKSDFLDFVDRVLMFRGNGNIHGFVLVTHSRIDVTDRLNTWILACVLRNVQELTLDTYFPEKFHFHRCLFTCKTLTHLVLNAHSDGFSISLPDSIALPRLKLLSLTSVKFEDECIMDQIFSSCPVLKSLTMKHCKFPHFNINISSLTLQHLILQRCTTRKTVYLDPVDFKFKLYAPNLKSFYCNYAMSIYCAPTNLCSLVKADINVYVPPDLLKEKKAMYAQCMMNILKKLDNVEELTLSASFLEVFAGAPYLLDSQPTEFCKLRCLKVKLQRCLKVMGTWRSIDNIRAISYLLKISPNTETLYIEECGGLWNAAAYMLDMQPTQFCNLRYLKMVEMLLSIDSIYVIAYFLKLSPKIETFFFKISFNSHVIHQYWNPDETNSNSANKGDFWEAVLSLESLLNHLKYFELRDVTGLINELELIEILLKNAMLLEKLLIVFCKADTKKEELERRLLRLKKFREKVFTFPTTSSSVDIEFRYST